MRALLVLLLVGACHHDPAPAEPSDKPPLPPASGTPIGFLIDDAGDLKLSDTQVAKLRDLDTSLAADLESIDAQTRQATKPTEESSAPPPSSGGRHHRGGMGGGGGGGGGRHHRNGGGTGSGAASPSGAAVANKLSDRRSADVKDALERAFAVLDATQQAAAKKVLADHDVDVDVNVAPPQLPPPSGGDEADPPPEP